MSSHSPEPLGLKGAWLDIWRATMNGAKGRCCCVGECGKKHKSIAERKIHSGSERCKTVHGHKTKLALIEDEDGAYAVYCPPCYRGMRKAEDNANAEAFHGQDGLFE